MSGAAWAGTQLIVSPRIDDIAVGLFCAPQSSGRRPAPDTMAGWVHVPDQPVEMVAEGQFVPAILGVGFGVRFVLDGDETARIRFTVQHPPMPPDNITSQSWTSEFSPGSIETMFFQFDFENELQPGDWSFRATLDGEDLFDVGFTVQPPSALPGLVGICQGGSLLSFNPPQRRAATG